jgi:hypothetical protein
MVMILVVALAGLILLVPIGESWANAPEKPAETVLGWEKLSRNR